MLYLLETKLGEIPLDVNCNTVPQFRNISLDNVRNNFTPSKGPFPIPHSTSVQPFSELRCLLHIFIEPVPVISRYI